MYLSPLIRSGVNTGTAIAQIVGTTSSSDDTLTFVFRTTDAGSGPTSGTIYLSNIQVYAKPDAAPYNGIYVGLMS